MLSCALMCHPKRADFVEELREQLPEAEVVWDRSGDRWDTGRRSLLAFDPVAEYHVVIQDDAIPCPDLLVAAERAAKAASGPVSLYTGKTRPHQGTITPAVRRARRKGSPWVVTTGPYWGVGLILPAVDIPDLVAWGDRHPQICNYDRRIGAYYASRQIHCWYTVPSLVDHRRVAENPSLIESRTGDRCAHWFAESSPLDIDWTRPPVKIHSTFRSDQRSVVVRVGSRRHRILSRDPAWKEAA